MSLVQGMVRSIRGNACIVRVGDEEYRCRFTGKLKREKRETNKIAAVGDNVELEPQADGEGLIVEVLPRRNHISRPDPINRTREQIIVANVDDMLIVHSLRNPDLDLLTIDKCIVMARANGVGASLVITKTDLGEVPDLNFYANTLPLYMVSSVQGKGVQDVQKALEGKTTVLLGPSGVGKSTLLNALDPSLQLKVGEVSEKTGEGRHTTTWVEVIDVGEARIVDTPGLEFFDFWNLTADQVTDCFDELDGWSCKFRDCRHDKEPGCRVKTAVKEGAIPPSRYENYIAIRRIIQEKGVAFSEPRRGRGPGAQPPPLIRPDRSL